MPYFMRYVTRDDHRLSLERIEQGLQKHNTDYHIQQIPNEAFPKGELRFGSERLGVLSINTPEDGHFESALDHMRRRLEQTDSENTEIKQLLKNARAFAALQVSWGDREAEETMDLLEPLWALLFARWDGLLQADDDGWHDPFGLVLKVASSGT